MATPPWRRLGNGHAALAVVSSSPSMPATLPAAVLAPPERLPSPSPPPHHHCPYYHRLLLLPPRHQPLNPTAFACALARLAPPPSPDEAVARWCDRLEEPEGVLAAAAAAAAAEEQQQPPRDDKARPAHRRHRRRPWDRWRGGGRRERLCMSSFDGVEEAEKEDAAPAEAAENAEKDDNTTPPAETPRRYARPDGHPPALLHGHAYTAARAHSLRRRPPPVPVPAPPPAPATAPPPPPPPPQTFSGERADADANAASSNLLLLLPMPGRRRRHAGVVPPPNSLIDVPVGGVGAVGPAKEEDSLGFAAAVADHQRHHALTPADGAADTFDIPGHLRAAVMAALLARDLLTR